VALLLLKALHHVLLLLRQNLIRELRELFVNRGRIVPVSRPSSDEQRHVREEKTRRENEKKAENGETHRLQTKINSTIKSIIE